MPTFLTEIQIKERVKQPKKAQAIQRAIRHEDRLRLHTEIALTKQTASPAIHDFLKYVETLLPADKFRLWLSLFRYPVKTVQDTDKIYDALSKVFDGQNPVFEVDFISPEYEDDFTEYDSACQDKWNQEVFEQIKLGINSIRVIDAPSVQNSTLPEPYAYWVNIRSVIDYDDPDGVFDWLIYRVDDTHFVYIDSVSYVTFEHEKGKVDEARVISLTNHDLTYCPAAWTMSESISPFDKDVKRSVLSSHLEELDFLLFLLIAKNQSDLSASYPITWSYEEDCDYSREDYDKGIYVKCDHGLLRDKSTQWVMEMNGNIARCPVCFNSRLTGPGTHIGVPIPDKNQGDIQIKEPAGFIGADVATLEYLVSEIERRKKNLYQDITGYGGEPPNKEAINEQQVIAAFESRSQILNDFKRPIEQLKTWEVSTKARLRHGDKFISCTYSMGTAWYLYNADDILNVYLNGQEKELDLMILDMLDDQYHATKFRNNPYELMEHEIIKNIKPYRHIPLSKLTSLATPRTDQLGNTTPGLISEKDLRIILNFPIFVLKFKREQSSLIEFGKNLSFKERIDAISKIIYSYA